MRSTGLGVTYMANKTFSQCMDIIMESIKQREHVDYSDRTSVKHFNAAYDRIFKNMQYIDTHYPDKLDLVIELLQTSAPDFICHCAPMFFRLKHSTYQQKLVALTAIKNVMEKDQMSPLDKLGFSESIKDWETQLARERLQNGGSLSISSRHPNHPSHP